MAGSKPAGLLAVWVRVPLRVRVNAHRLGVAVAKSPTSVREGVLWGRAARVVLCVWLVSSFCGGRALRVACVIIEYWLGPVLSDGKG